MKTDIYIQWLIKKKNERKGAVSWDFLKRLISDNIRHIHLSILDTFELYYVVLLLRFDTVDILSFMF